MATIDNPGGLAVSSPAAAKQRRVSLFDQININVFWIANNFHWQALLAIVIPSMVAKFLGDAHKDINLTLVVAWGTLVAVVVYPLFCAIFHFATFRLGRRRPLMFFCTLLYVIFLFVFFFSPVLSSCILLF